MWPSTEQNHCGQLCPTERPLSNPGRSLSLLEIYSRVPGSPLAAGRCREALCPTDTHYHTADWTDRHPWLSPGPRGFPPSGIGVIQLLQSLSSLKQQRVGDTRVTGDTGPHGALRHTAGHSTPSRNCLEQDITEITCAQNCCCRSHCSDRRCRPGFES